MKRQPWVNFVLAGVSITEFGLMIPSPFTRLTLSNSEVNSFTSWTLNVTVVGDDTKKSNIAAFEALLYSAAQAASGYKDSSGIPVSFMFGWLDDGGQISEYLSYQGFTLQFKVSTSGRTMNYDVMGYASVAIQANMPVLNIPELSGIVQPSAVVEAVANGVKAGYYYDLDIDHNDAPTYINHGNLVTSFTNYVRGSYTGQDDYDSFPGLLKLAKSYNGSRDAGGVDYRRAKSIRQVLDHAKITPVSEFLRISNPDSLPQCSSFCFWIDEPTMTSRGTIHFKSNAGLAGLMFRDTLEYGTANSNILSLSGSYNGVAYNMTDMNFKNVGFTVDGSGATVVQDYRVVNSWSSSLAEVFQSANIINDVNAIASQFTGDFTITIPGSVKLYQIAQPITLLVMAGNTISPITGIYNIVSVSHDISTTFVTTLKIQRFVMSTANETAAIQGITIRNSSNYSTYSYKKTKNIISTGKVDFGDMYPDFTHLSSSVW